jgi:hypothetical protein
MMNQLPEAISAGRLTDVLRHCGALSGGRVSQVELISTRDTILSRVIRLHLSYEGGSGGPASLILKTGNPTRPEGGWNAGRHEATFYTNVASLMSLRLVPQCFEGHHDPEKKVWFLLLEDLTDSHYIAAPELPPTLEQCRAIVRARARFHAAWWDDPRLGTTVGTWPDAAAEKNYLQRLANAVERFVSRLGDRLPRRRRELYERLLAAAPRLLDRQHSRVNLTVVQWDAHVWNCFLPKDAGSDDVRIFDWDSWRIDVGTDDLACMMALKWYPDQRRTFERPLLDLYSETLLKYGINYDRQELDTDYRLSALWHIMTPVWQAAYDIPLSIWWTNLQRIFMAVDDLDCRELVD